MEERRMGVRGNKEQGRDGSHKGRGGLKEREKRTHVDKSQKSATNIDVKIKNGYIIEGLRSYGTHEIHVKEMHKKRNARKTTLKNGTKKVCKTNSSDCFYIQKIGRWFL